MFVPQSKYLLLTFATTIGFVLWPENTTAFPTSSFANSDATIYLKTFGWLDSKLTENGSESIQQFKESLEEFQAFQSLPTTGQLDTSTLEIMKLPRCGVSDKPNGIVDALLVTPNWESMNLTYKISKYPSSLQTLGGKERIDAEISKAFAVWAAATPFTFTPTTNLVDIDISFEHQQQSDGRNFSFDGPAMTLAYASYHPSGVIYFNDEQDWTTESNQGVNFLQIAVHEIGHALGLGHSNVGNALMFPIYNGYVRNFQLNSHDIQQLVAVYSSTIVYHGRTQPNEKRKKRSLRSYQNQGNYYEDWPEASDPLEAYDGPSYSDEIQQPLQNSDMRHYVKGEDEQQPSYPSSESLASHGSSGNRQSRPKPGSSGQSKDGPLEWSVLIQGGNSVPGPIRGPKIGSTCPRIQNVRTTRRPGSKTRNKKKGKGPPLNMDYSPYEWIDMNPDEEQSEAMDPMEQYEPSMEDPEDMDPMEQYEPSMEDPEDTEHHDSPLEQYDDSDMYY